MLLFVREQHLQLQTYLPQLDWRSFDLAPRICMFFFPSSLLFLCSLDWNFPSSLSGHLLAVASLPKPCEGLESLRVCERL